MELQSLEETVPVIFKFYCVALAVGLLLVFDAAPANAPTSVLWGQNGELWTPQSRLPDFSFAGYHSGNDPIPDVPVKANVKSFGAVGDGETDDSQAFLNAVASVSNGAVFMPAGRYKIGQVVKINNSNIVLRGAGQGSTVLYFPKSLLEILGRSTSLFGHNGYWCWAGGLIWCGPGQDDGVKLASVVAPALRGDQTLTLSSTAGIAAGTTVRLVEHEKNGSLGRYLHAGYADAGTCVMDATGGKFIDFASNVKSVSGSTITLERPLRADVRLDWQPEVFSYLPTLQEIGIENLTIEFPKSQYGGHVFQEPGYNGIYLDAVSNSWVRNVTIIDADSGIVTAPSAKPFAIGRFCTLEGIRLEVHWRNKALSGHHGIALESPHDYLVSNFTVDTQFVHDLTVDTFANGNVFSEGKGIDVNFDHHRAVPFENLFTNIDVGSGSRLWKNGGSECAGPNSGARETLWRIQATSPQSYPNYPQLNIVGMTAWPASKSDLTWIEPIPPPSLVPVNIHLAQLSRRLKKTAASEASGGDKAEVRQP
jgi:pectate lyase-like protein